MPGTQHVTNRRRCDLRPAGADRHGDRPPDQGPGPCRPPREVVDGIDVAVRAGTGATGVVPCRFRDVAADDQQVHLTQRVPADGIAAAPGGHRPAAAQPHGGGLQPASRRDGATTQHRDVGGGDGGEAPGPGRPPVVRRRQEPHPRVAFGDAGHDVPPPRGSHDQGLPCRRRLGPQRSQRDQAVPPVAEEQHHGHRGPVDGSAPGAGVGTGSRRRSASACRGREVTARHPAWMRRTASWQRRQDAVRGRRARGMAPGADHVAVRAGVITCPGGLIEQGVGRAAVTPPPGQEPHEGIGSVHVTGPLGRVPPHGFEQRVRGVPRAPSVHEVVVDSRPVVVVARPGLGLVPAAVEQA